MQAHHRAVVDRLVERFGKDPRFPALLVGGSIAKGWERDDSDVDVIMLATDEEYQRRRPERAFHYFTTDVCDYPGGYVDGKILDWQFLVEVAERGSEPARSAFSGAIVAYSRCPELEALLQRIVVYPEAQRQERIRSFYAQFQALRWYVGEAEKRNNRYLMVKMVADLVLFGSRLILAHNRILYPYHKWLMATLQGAPEKPAGMLELADELLADPCREKAERYCESIERFTGWDKPPEGWPSRFMEDTEWSWRRDSAGVADW